MIDIYTIGKKGVFGLAICTSSEEGPPSGPLCPLQS